MERDEDHSSMGRNDVMQAPSNAARRLARLALTLGVLAGAMSFASDANAQLFRRNPWRATAYQYYGTGYRSYRPAYRNFNTYGYRRNYVQPYRTAPGVNYRTRNTYIPRTPAYPMLGG